jgi:hypothetical protein
VNAGNTFTHVVHVLLSMAQLLEEKSTFRLRIDISWSMHCKEDPVYVFPEMKLRGLVLNSYINV